MGLHHHRVHINYNFGPLDGTQNCCPELVDFSSLFLSVASLIQNFDPPGENRTNVGQKQIDCFGAVALTLEYVAPTSHWDANACIL